MKVISLVKPFSFSYCFFWRSIESIKDLVSTGMEFMVFWEFEIEKYQYTSIWVHWGIFLAERYGKLGPI